MRFPTQVQYDGESILFVIDSRRQSTPRLKAMLDLLTCADDYAVIAEKDEWRVTLHRRGPRAGPRYVRYQWRQFVRVCQTRVGRYCCAGVKLEEWAKSLYPGQLLTTDTDGPPRRWERDWDSGTRWDHGVWNEQGVTRYEHGKHNLLDV
ncbi:hypothetical protein FSARC_580 [Fusarium sarcochroum]|uniref:Uncharacterized protein n=1 Tax=Fusarium sarcochroum TaxID=1208366 RepID=A0A8H4UAQ9_9HYPO|nr:hypothetical protein FSARC_580 [Fusarium sarcochroum]